MRKLRLVPIVEGFGEEQAMPVLIRRWLRHRRFDQWFEVPDLAVNAKGCGRLKAPFDAQRHVGIEHYVRAALNGKPDAILAVLDGDNECLQRSKGQGLGPELLARARRIAGAVPVSVVVANRTYEAWLLAGRTALHRSRLVRADAPLRTVTWPEVPSSNKGFLNDCLLEKERAYSPPVHQPALTEVMSFSPGSQKRSPSLAKLLRELSSLATAARRRA